ncbi:MAG: 3-phosphoshikimate 1-carboxyvinyltransferase, partial [Firmicutes bacterium]|nr:3-phosphoshikimate 1-carboxyvinyltransferase [Bacillota bacterium]
GDRKIIDLLSQIGNDASIDIRDTPDLLPILSVAATQAKGKTTFVNAARLRLKESDRLESTADLINTLGGKAETTEDTLTVYGIGLVGGSIDSCNDHRIAMSAAIAATVCSETVTIRGAEAVNKSYPAFFEDYNKLGGNAHGISMGK